MYLKSKILPLLLSISSIVYPAYDIEMFTFYPYHCESNLMNQMKKVFDCDVFVETGTLVGETAFCAAPIFDAVYTRST